MVKSLALALEGKQSATNSLPPGASNPLRTTTFVRGGQETHKCLLDFCLILYDNYLSDMYTTVHLALLWT